MAAAGKTGVRMDWIKIGQEINRALTGASRGQRYQLMEAAAARHGLSARRVRDVAACAEFLDEISQHSPLLHEVLARRSITDVMRVMNGWRGDAASRPKPETTSTDVELYVATTLDAARKARNADLARQRRPAAEPDFFDYLRSPALTWVPTDKNERWRTPSTAQLDLTRFGMLPSYPQLRHFIDVDWRRAEGEWTYRKLQMVGFKTQAHDTNEISKPVIGIRFISAPSITQIKERAIGVFLEAMGLCHWLEEVVLVVSDEQGFHAALDMCAKADLKNGNYNVWWMYPLGNLEPPWR